MISVVQNGPVYEIRFPYNSSLVEMVKNVPGRRWNPEEKYWYVPKDKIGFFLNQLKDTSFEQQLKLDTDESFNVNASIKETEQQKIPDIDVSNVRTYVKKGGKLFSHQIDCLKYSIGRKERGNFSGFLLADQMGCVSGFELVDVEINGRRKSMTLSRLFKEFSSRQVSVLKIKSYVEETRKFRYLDVRCVLNKGRKPCVSVVFRDGTSLVCTPDHEVMCSFGWMEAGSLKPGDCVVKEYWTEFDRYKGVECVKPYGTVEVFDVGVNHPTAHNFVCNDVVVHNCGKTLEVINLALFKKQYEKAKHCLVICCVNSAKYNWAEDIKAHTNGEYEGYILGSRKSKRTGRVNPNGSSADKLKDLETGWMYSDEKEQVPLPYFLIANVEFLRLLDTKRKRGEKDVAALKIADMILNGEISMVAVDEIHRNASPQSTQGKELLRIKQLTGSRAEWIPMTGTPVVNKPTDVFVPMRLIDATECNSYCEWNHHYCIYGGYGNHSINGYKNIPELKSILEANMLRRTKDQVLDLPPKIHHVEYVENTPYQKKLYNSVLVEIKSSMDEVKRSMNPLEKLVKLRQVNGCPECVDLDLDARSDKYSSCNAKIKKLVEIVQDVVENNEKAVVFSNWIAPLRSAYRALSKQGFSVVAYTGSMDQAEREANKEKFINDPNCNVILGTIGALGTSHTLTVASNVVFLDSSWNMATQEQAEDRCHRATSTSPVNVYEIITKNTVDEKVYDIMRRKGSVSDYIVDDSLDVKKHPEVLECLLS